MRGAQSIQTQPSFGVRRTTGVGAPSQINILCLISGDRPLIGGIMPRAIGPVGYVAGWGLADGMDAAFGWDGD